MVLLQKYKLGYIVVLDSLELFVRWRCLSFVSVDSERGERQLFQDGCQTAQAQQTLKTVAAEKICKFHVASKGE